ncbi:MAG: hypothetical protein MJ210_04540 [Alphaproteobacteria bacterium]|nr:hypothetical protein [Alphaproteobacteria bacterium]
MEFSQIFQAFISLLFVLGLLFITLWGIKTCQQKGINFCLKNRSSKKSKINILECKRLDANKSFVLVEYKNEEFLLLLGNNNMIVSRHSAQKEKGTSDV